MQIIDSVRLDTELLHITIPNKPGVGFTISCGLARLDDYKNINHSIKQADEALYFSKKRGKNQVSFTPKAVSLALMQSIKTPVK